MRNWILKNSNRVRHILNLWPPFLFSGIRITEISPDYRRCRAELKNWPGTRNANGSQFGGSLFSMTDPVYSLMLMGLLGERYFIWDKSAHIDFIKPGRSKIFLECMIGDDLLHDIRTHTANGEKYLPEIEMILTDEKGDIIAKVKRTLYIRLKPAFRPSEHSAS
ncbi:translation elongation factor P (EF-P) [Neisseria arctica]|uniref:Translation elongation factor P (EF-P) n=1 Tax=Neisseria arctica TaxID=1470200 RepID=A0A0J0YQM6_9NEIS|nr:DUF4442 domain-containing protein [Neisseria arctica]KLT72431.1 translation elongation factor P (EF-P) [Neisseria arctica]UOO85995.1 DUF4442 domain-containing protein [Neisseria arctica]